MCRFHDPNADISMQPGWFYLIASPPGTGNTTLWQTPISTETHPNYPRDKAARQSTSLSQYADIYVSGADS